MTLHLDTELTEDQNAAMSSIPATSWFTSVVWKNAASPVHPNPKLAENNIMKQEMANDWIKRSVKGKRVLDLFSANGIFTFQAALAGAKEITGIEFSQERVKCAEFIAQTIQTDCVITFKCGDVYKICDYFNEPFDVVLCLGGLYHVADPAYILRQIHNLTKERLILQTAQVLPEKNNIAKFIVRGTDETDKGMTSIRGGYGTWHYSPACLRELLLHGGFKVLEERLPPRNKRKRFPWYIADCEPL